MLEVLLDSPAEVGESDRCSLSYFSQAKYQTDCGSEQTTVETVKLQNQWLRNLVAKLY